MKRLLKKLFHQTKSTSSSKPQPLHSRPQLEDLEERLVMAGDVTAAVIGGDLVINGDALGNGVVVSQIDSDSWAVSGRYQAGGSTRINGQYGGVQLHGVTDDVRIDLNGGDDYVSLSGFVQDDLVINTDSGDDRVEINWSAIGDDVIINTGSGADNIRITNTDVGHIGDDGGNNDVDINAGSGYDVVWLEGMDVDDDLRVTGENWFAGSNDMHVDDYYSEAWRYPWINFRA